MTYSIYDVLGNLGVFLIILTYFLLQIRKLSSESLLYSALNALGASLIVVSLLFDFNLSAFIVEAFWVIISLIGIGRFYLRRGAGKT
ncbi:MAG: hypothetical protein IH820_06115 [Bacteroidetes bacterium]|nr:hypothetical protein [Bacteroidota bacterium]